MQKELHYFNETIGVYRKTLSESFCNSVISLFESESVQRHVERGSTFSGIDLISKNSFDVNIASLPEFSSIVDTITQVSNNCINDYVFKWQDKGNPQFDSNSLFGEGTFYPIWNLQKYEKDQGHYNSWHVESDPCYEPSRGRGYRIFAVMFYLNNVEEGGETSFLYSGAKISPEAGTFVCWPATWPWVHSGQKPISHDKYILTTWLQGVWAKEIEES